MSFRVLVNCWFGKPRAKELKCHVCGRGFEIINTSKKGRPLKNPYYKNINNDSKGYFHNTCYWTPIQLEAMGITNY